MVSKLAIGNGYMLNGVLEWVLIHPLALVTVRVTVNGPRPLKLCVGFCRLEVLGAPDNGSPKSHNQVVMFPPPPVCDWSVNCTGCPTHVIVDILKFASGEGMLVTVLIIKAVQPLSEVTVSFTL